MFRLLLLLLSVVLSLATPLDDNITQIEDVQIRIAQGILVGTKESLGVLAGSYFSFKGIPYAEPPVGALRFRAPQTHKGWTGIRDASRHGAECMQPTVVPGATFSEDCLFLNVYSLSLDDQKPVMVWIHGGAYYGGSGNSLLYGPELLVRQDVVIVTINYRLGILGFFSTGDQHAQGNYGLKDCIEALQWVQKNIHHFGGDPNRVTIFGESAGSALVSYLVMTPLARGLFHGAISESGVTLTTWAFQDRPAELAQNLSRRLNLRATTNDRMVNEMRQITDVNLFVEALRTSDDDLEVPRYVWPFEFGPVIEPDWIEVPALTAEPLDLINAGQWNKVPYIIGTNSHECLYAILELRDYPDVLDILSGNPHLLIPRNWDVAPGSPEASEIVTSFQNVYFGGESPADEMDYANWVTDNVYHWPSYKFSRLIAANQEAPVFSYIFEYSSVLNYAKHISLLSSYPGAMHADEAFYLWRFLPVAPVIPGSAPDRVRSRLIQMWTNFAKTGNPTPEITSLITAQWPRLGENHEFMWIKEELEPSTRPLDERMSIWEELDQKFGPKGNLLRT